MEIETENGTTIPLNDATATDFGRGLGFDTDDRTVSRRHVSFTLKIDTNSNVTDELQRESGLLRVQFEVIGKNPLWIRSFDKDSEVGIRVYKRGDVGEMGSGDSFCVSGKKPVWFKLRRKDKILERIESYSGDDDDGDGDVLDIDPVKEFGFLVIGNEFNAYSKQMIRDITKWNWFLEEPKKVSDEEGTSEEKRITRKKKKRTGGIDDDDDEWTDEREDGKQELVSQPGKFQKTNYSTRSKDQKNKSMKNSQSSKKSVQKNSIRSYQGDEDDNEDEDGDDDDTLGGFIVDDVEAEDEDVDEDEDEDEDEEEEFVDEEELDQ